MGIFGIAIGTAAASLFADAVRAAKGLCAVFPRVFGTEARQSLGQTGTGRIFTLPVIAGGLYGISVCRCCADESAARGELFHLVLCLLLIRVLRPLGRTGRAGKNYELLFWVLLIPLFLMLFFSLDEIRTDYWIPVFTAGAGSVAEGGYYVFSALAVIMLILFLGNRVKKRKDCFDLENVRCF